MFVIGATRSRAPPMPVPEPFGQGVGRFSGDIGRERKIGTGKRRKQTPACKHARVHPPEAPRGTPKSRRPCRRNALHVARRRTSGHDYGRARCQHENSRQSASRRALTYTTLRRQSVQYMPSRLPEMQECDLVPTSDVRLPTFHKDDQIIEETSVPVQRGLFNIEGHAVDPALSSASLSFRSSSAHCTASARV
jgi:hypothetical protein